MRVFIVVDMEGATGVVHREQLMHGGDGYAAGRVLLTGDVNAVIEGVLSVDPTATFVVGDGHGAMRNVILEDLNPAAELVIGPAQPANKPLVQCEGIDESFNVAVLVGFHTRAGTPGGLLAHTFVGSTIRNLKLNGRVVGEAEADAAILGSFGVPVGLVIGNSELEAEIREWNTECGFVSTKRTLGPTAAVCKPPTKTASEIAAAAASMATQAASKAFPSYLQGRAVRFEIETYRREMTDKAVVSETVQRTGDSSFAAEGLNGAEAFANVWKGLALALQDTQAWLQ